VQAAPKRLHVVKRPKTGTICTTSYYELMRARFILSCHGYKSFPVQDDEHFFTVCRYVERNALRANLVELAQQWRWGSLHRWAHGTPKDKSLLAPWPLPRRPGWLNHVNTP